MFYNWVHFPPRGNIGESVLSGGMKPVPLPLCLAWGHFRPLVGVVVIKCV